MNTKQKLALGVSLPCITVSSLDQAKKLFVDLLGFEITDFNEQFHWMEVGTKEAGSQIGIGAPAKENQDQNFQPGANAILSISVENLESAKESLASKGVEFIGQIIEIPGEIKMILFRDFDNNKFFLTQDLSS